MIVHLLIGLAFATGAYPLAVAWQGNRRTTLRQALAWAALAWIFSIMASLGMRAATEPYALLLAQTARQRFSAHWAMAESGAAGPAGNRYGDAAGHSCIAVAGPTDRAMTLETGSGDRLGNMHAFTAAALELLLDAIAAEAGSSA